MINMDVICDTNIWYLAGSGHIDLNIYSSIRFWATYLAIDELSRSDKLIDDDRIGEVRFAIQEVVKNQRIFIEPPFFNLLSEFSPDFHYEMLDDDYKKLDFFKINC